MKKRTKGGFCLANDQAHLSGPGRCSVWLGDRTPVRNKQIIDMRWRFLLGRCSIRLSSDRKPPHSDRPTYTHFSRTAGARLSALLSPGEESGLKIIERYTLPGYLAVRGENRSSAFTHPLTGCISIWGRKWNVAADRSKSPQRLNCPVSEGTSYCQARYLFLPPN